MKHTRGVSLPNDTHPKWQPSQVAGHVSDFQVNP